MSRPRLRNTIHAWLPLAALVIAFMGITNTTIKIVLMGGVLLLQFKRTIRALDVLVPLLFLSVAMYCLIGTQYNDYQIVAYQLLLFPLFTYLLGKSFSSAAASPKAVLVGLLLLAVTLSLFPLFVAMGTIASEGFVGGARSLYVDDFGQSISATVMGGPMTFAMSQVAVSISQGYRGRFLTFVISLVLGTMLVAASLRLGSRTQIAIFVICLLGGYWLTLSGRRVLTKKVLLLVAAGATFFLAAGMMPGFLESDYGEYFRDRAVDSRYGADSFGGRTEKWSFALQHVFQQPMGWGLMQGGYAHNLWLDVARVSGVLGLITFSAFTVIHLRLTLRRVWNLRSKSLRAGLLTAVLAANMLFMLEPILDGFLYVFYAYCAVVGIAIGSKGRIRTLGGGQKYMSPHQ